MGINWSEHIVKKDMERKGYEVVKTTHKGEPDFKSFNFETKDCFYLEVKTKPIHYTKEQLDNFKKIEQKIIIAVVDNGWIYYLDYKTKEKLMESTYGNKEKQAPNIQCKKCKYEWYTTSKYLYVSCPNCLNKVKIAKVEKVEE